MNYNVYCSHNKIQIPQTKTETQNATKNMAFMRQASDEYRWKLESLIMLLVAHRRISVRRTPHNSGVTFCSLLQFAPGGI